MGPEVLGTLMQLLFETLLSFHVLVFIVTSSSSTSRACGGPHAGSHKAEPPSQEGRRPPQERQKQQKRQTTALGHLRQVSCELQVPKCTGEGSRGPREPIGARSCPEQLTCTPRSTPCSDSSVAFGAEPSSLPANLQTRAGKHTGTVKPRETEMSSSHCD